MKRIPAQQPVILSDDEKRILTAFRTMDQRARNDNLVQMELDAEKYPDRPAPTLRLIAGGL